MLRINIIGRGNVATHLMKAFSGKAECQSVNPHTLENLDPNADITLISVSDNAIAEVAAKLKGLHGIVAHTSGTIPLSLVAEIMPSTECGVFYPMQTFSKETELDYCKIPFFIEGKSEATEKALMHAASLISENVRIADSAKRKALHIGAVLSCNFANHLWTLADNYLKCNGIDFKDMLPLIDETTRKIHNLSPQEAQTGPAVRRDLNVIENHLHALEKYPVIQKIYKDLTDSIQSI